MEVAQEVTKQHNVRQLLTKGEKCNMADKKKATKKAATRKPTLSSLSKRLDTLERRLAGASQGQRPQQRPQQRSQQRPQQRPQMAQRPMPQRPMGGMRPGGMA
tara:strand:+ start:6900 stop:7208 length:309 start_codon:yes stop_codon:yes gene_type:complete